MGDRSVREYLEALSDGVNVLCSLHENVNNASDPGNFITSDLVPTLDNLIDSLGTLAVNNSASDLAIPARTVQRLNTLRNLVNEYVNTGTYASTFPMIVDECFGLLSHLTRGRQQ